MYAIIGATGNTGASIANALLDAGKKVRVIGRSAEKLAQFESKGAEIAVGSAEDKKFLAEAFDGVEAVYALIPPKFDSNDFLKYQINVAEAIASAMKQAKVKSVVSLSSQAAHLESGTGMILGLNKMEKIFDEVEGLNTLHLRPAYFMENTLGMIDLIKHKGIMGSPVKADISFPLIASKDISEYASKRLLALDFEGNNTQDLLGERNLTYSEITKIFGEALGKPELPYIEFSYEDFKGALMGQMGASENVADKFNEMIKLMNDNNISSAVRSPENATPTSIEEFAQTFKHIYNM